LITRVPRLPPTWLTTQPKPLQFIEALFIREFLTYGKHWAMHNNTFLWRFHAVHHSSETLSWHSALRNHPGEDFLTAIITILPMYCMGFPPPIIGAVVNLLTVYDMFVHSNIRLNLGFLNHLVVTPEFHRWHHSNEPDKLNRNYGSSLPIYDYIFGTAIKPTGQPSKSYGLHDESIPPNYIELLKYPFRRKPPTCKPAEPGAEGSRTDRDLGT
jgi:sterol desaturase/sphingolipid hydroxylase (fatty acid hydroxylase superfamily)